MTSRVSILIPAHNAAPWIEETIRSALVQVWANKEIIVVDDGSTDDTLSRARQFSSAGVRVVSQPNRGASAARNRAWQESTGEWLQFLDADDLLDPRKIDVQLRRAAELGSTYAYCARWTRFTHSPGDADFAPQPLCRDADTVSWITLKLRDNVMMHPAAWLISRELAARAGPWDESLSLDDDGEFFTRVVLASAGVRWCPEAVSFYRSNLAGSLSGSKSEKAWQSAFRSLESGATCLLAAENSLSTRHAVAIAYQRFIYESYPATADCRALAAKRIRELGGCTVAPDGGPKFRLAARLFGWRIAKRLLLLSKRL